MGTQFHVGDTVKVKKAIYGAPKSSIGMQGIVKYIDTSNKDDDNPLSIEVEFPCYVNDWEWWIYTPKELELVHHRTNK